MLTTFKIDCDPWGVTVERVEVCIQDIWGHYTLLYIILISGEKSSCSAGDGCADGHGS